MLEGLFAAGGFWRLSEFDNPILVPVRADTVSQAG